MGDIADSIINGEFCQECGEHVGEGEGYPVSCSGCSGDDSSPNLSNHAAIKRDRTLKAPFTLDKAGIEYTSHNYGSHLIITTACGLIDFWPGNDHWKTRSGSKGSGIQNLILEVTKRKLKPSFEAPPPKAVEKRFLTRRDKFAMTAMGAMISSYGNLETSDLETERLAEVSVQYSDALIAQLDKVVPE